MRGICAVLIDSMGSSSAFIVTDFMVVSRCVPDTVFRGGQFRTNQPHERHVARAREEFVRGFNAVAAFAAARIYSANAFGLRTRLACEP